MSILSKAYRFVDYCSRKRNEKNIVPINIPVQESNLLKGKIALIVGGSGGIGIGIAEAFISAGAKVIVSGTREASIAKALQKLESGTAKGIVINLSEVSKFNEIIDAALSQFPEHRIDILVNCAGVHGNEKFGEVSEETWDSVLDTNLKGMFFMTQSVSNYMIKNHVRGHILNVSSAGALKPGYTPYEISKSGVYSFTRGAAAELIKYGIVVNAIGPGPVATQMLGRSDSDTLFTDCVPSMRFATPLEIGQIAVIMASSMCDLVVGDTWYISGGSGTIKMR